MSRVEEGRRELAARRREVEHRLREVRRALGRELGWAPRSRPWLFALLALAAGLALGLAVKGRRPDGGTRPRR